jgi:hypothetical protein
MNERKRKDFKSRDKGGGGGRERERESKGNFTRIVLHTCRREFVFLCGFTIDWILLIAQVISDNFHVRQLIIILSGLLIVTCMLYR